MSHVCYFHGTPTLRLFLMVSAATLIHAQDAPATASKLALKADLVLTKDFCATKTKKGSFISGKETFAIGQAACPELEMALRGAFSNLTRVEVEPSPASTSAQVVLIPKFVDIGATKMLNRYSNRELVVLLEWTVKDAAGKPVWVETVQGSAKGHTGNVFTAGGNRKRIVGDAIKDLAQTSAQKISASPELGKLAK